jgi:hypothetical protein
MDPVKFPGHVEQPDPFRTEVSADRTFPTHAEKLLAAVTECNEIFQEDASNKEKLASLVPLYEQINEHSKFILQPTNLTVYTTATIQPVCAKLYHRHFGKVWNVIVDQPNYEMAAVFLQTLPPFFTTEAFLEGWNTSNNMLEKLAWHFDDMSKVHPVTGKICLEICSAIVAGFQLCAESTASHHHVVMDALYCMHNHHILAPALRAAFQILESDGDVTSNLIFLDYVFEGIEFVVPLIRGSDDFFQYGMCGEYNGIFREVMTVALKIKHNSLLIAQYRALCNYVEFERESDWYDFIFETRPSAL